MYIYEEKCFYVIYNFWIDYRVKIIENDVK
jgi:hypothetical protein